MLSKLDVSLAAMNESMMLFYKSKLIIFGILDPVNITVLIIHINGF